MRSLVTGGAGFFGGHLIRRLLDAGAAVRTLDLLPLRDPQLTTRVHAILGDVRDPAAVRRAMDGVDVVFHAAALVPITRAGRGFRSVNVEGTRQVLEAAQRVSAAHVIFLSSSAIYGVPARRLISEDGPFNPLGPYARSKLEAEHICDAYRRGGLPVSILRPCTIVGPGRLGILELLFDWIRRDRPVYILGRGDNPYQLVSTRDVAEVCVRVSTTPRARGLDFNVGAAEFGTLREDLEDLIHHAGSASRIVHVSPRVVRPVLRALDVMRLSPFVEWHYHTIDRDFAIDISRVRTVLNWTPADSNAATLCQAYDWYIRHLGTGAPDARSPHQQGLRRRLLHWLP